jgi:hypothetical protein
MGRPRKNNRELPPGLYCYPGRNCYIRLGEAKPVDLGTTVKDEALVIYWEHRRLWDAKRMDTRTAIIVSKLQAAINGTDRLTVSGYSQSWRTTILPTLTKKNGKPLGNKTRADYARMLVNQVENNEIFKDLALTDVTPKVIRIFLGPWISSPSFYNYMKSLMSRMLKFALDEGKIDFNPVEQIDRRPVAKRETYISHKDYLAITAKMLDWESKACDLLYMVSHRPNDVLSLKDSNIYGGIVRFTATKNDVDMEIGMNDALEEIVTWFRNWKTQQGIVSPFLVVYPKSTKRRFIGKPVSVGYLSGKFSEAVVSAGLTKGIYTLRDIRPKGLSDEFVTAGDSDKGGHKTDAMKQLYRRIRVPMRAKNNLRRPRG